jgi:hypothetical protein
MQTVSRDVRGFEAQFIGLALPYFICQFHFCRFPCGAMRYAYCALRENSQFSLGYGSCPRFSVPNQVVQTHSGDSTKLG